ncbi:MAG: hypothetical protein ACRDVG_02215, partial [Jatrophihabitantaceae bacterium]
AWLPDRRAPFGPREVRATLRTHPRSLWESSIYVGLAVAVMVISDVVLGSSGVVAITLPLLVGFVLAGLFRGRLEALHRHDVAMATESEPTVPN